MFFKILPISNTGDAIAYILATVHFLYSKLGSFSDMECYFYHLAYGDSKSKLNQMQCYTHDFRFYSKGNASGTHQSTWAGSLKPQFAWVVRGLRPLSTPNNGGTAKGRPKNHQIFLAIFIGLCLTPITSIWRAL